MAKSRITVVTGPPCAGKSTHIRENRASSDVVVDFDALAQALGATTAHGATDGIKRAAHAARDAVINQVLQSRDTWAWIIHSSPRPEWMRRYQAAGAEVVTLDPGMGECMRRARSDARPDWTASAIRSWYDRHGNDGGAMAATVAHGGDDHTATHGRADS